MLASVVLTSEGEILQRTSTRIAAILVAALIAVASAPPAAVARPLFGTWSPGEPYGGSLAKVEALERATGRRVDIVHWFQNWGGIAWDAAYQANAIKTVTASGRIPLLSWEPQDPQNGVQQPAYALARIADGAHDAYIASFARTIRDTASLIFLRPMHEMNGNWYPWGAGVSGNTAADFIRAWRRIHGIFAAEGARNVLWVWSPNNFDVSSAYPLEAFYPGQAYVDVLAADGYNWGSQRPQFGGWQSFRQVFASAYERLKALGPQPIWLAEVASAPDGGDKPAWVRDMLGRAETMDRLQALVWFNELKELDWRADADPLVAAAFAPLAPGVSYPLVPDGDESAPPMPGAGELAASAASAASARSGSRPRGDGTADGDGDGDGTDLADAAALDASGLIIYARQRVPAGRRTTLRWKAGNVTGVRCWAVYLDGRRVRHVRVGRGPQRVRRRVMSLGSHRWRIIGHDADGRIVSATRSFRVVRAR